MVTLRDATEADRGTIECIFAAATKELPEKTDQGLEESFDVLIESESTAGCPQVVVAEDNNHIIAWGILYLDTNHLGVIFSDPAITGRAKRSTVIERLEERARAAGVSRLPIMLY